MSLRDVRISPDGLKWERVRRHVPESALADHLAEARRIIAEASPGDDVVMQDLTEDFEHLRWFPLPGEIRSPIA
jgi:hypothetical protein